MAFTQSPSLRNKPKILNKYLIFTDKQKVKYKHNVKDKYKHKVKDKNKHNCKVKNKDEVMQHQGLTSILSKTMANTNRNAK